MTEVTILAASRLGDGVCVAGVTGDGDWVRPTRPNAPDTWRQLERSDCEDSNGKWVVRRGNVVTMDLVQSIPKGAHSEDWLIGNRKPKLVKELSEEDYQCICEDLTEDSLENVDCEDAKRSLVLVHPDKITSFSFALETSWEGQRKYIPRCNFRLSNRLHLRMGITDLEWRGYGRQVMRKHGGDCLLKADDIFEENSTNDCWLTIGRNLLRSRFYLLAAGIHLFPVRHFDMNFKRV
jgi:hypothetical protein